MLYNDLRSCDVLLCSGNGKTSKRIKKFNKLTGVRGDAAELSHVALVSKLAVHPKAFESTTLNEFSGKSGVQENYFDEWLRNYNGKVWVRRFNFYRDSHFVTECDKVMASHIGDPYESGIFGGFELFLAGLRMDRYVRKVFPNYRPATTMNPHCSEIDTIVLQKMQLITFNAIPSRLPPSQWWGNGDVEDYLRKPLGKPERLK